MNDGIFKCRTLSFERWDGNCTNTSLYKYINALHMFQNIEFVIHFSFCSLSNTMVKGCCMANLSIPRILTKHCPYFRTSLDSCIHTKCAFCINSSYGKWGYCAQQLWKWRVNFWILMHVVRLPFGSILVFRQGTLWWFLSPPFHENCWENLIYDLKMHIQWAVSIVDNQELAY